MELFIHSSLLIRFLCQFYMKFIYGQVTKLPGDDGLLSEPTTEVDGNDIKRVT